VARSDLQGSEVLDEGNLVAPQVDLAVFERADEGRGPCDQVSIQPHGCRCATRRAGA
jgi:hypothetical protein